MFWKCAKAIVDDPVLTYASCYRVRPQNIFDRNLSHIANPNDLETFTRQLETMVLTMCPLSKLKGIVLQLFFFRSNLILCSVIWCLCATIQGPSAPSFEVPCTTPQYYPKYEIWSMETKLWDCPFNTLIFIVVFNRPVFKIYKGFCLFEQRENCHSVKLLLMQWLLQATIA